jgi:hypothetical protein
MRRFWQTLAQLLASAAVCGVLVLGCSTASAQAPTPKDKAHARELYALGQQMFRQGDFGGALRAFEDAYRSVPNPVVLLSVAECQVRIEQYTEAVVSLTRYLEERPQAPDRPQVEAQIQKLREKPGIVSVESTPPGANIWVDGLPTALTTPADVELLAGDHVVVVEAPGYSTAQQNVTVLIGSRQRVSLAPLPEAKPEETAPAAPAVDLNAKATSHGRTAIWVATGVGAAGLVAGAVLGGMALKTKGDFDAKPSETTADKGERLALFADVGFGIAAAAGITAVVLYVTSDKDKDKKEQSWSVKPQVAKQRFGLTGKLSF